jgi:hypothetical protein
MKKLAVILAVVGVSLAVVACSGANTKKASAPGSAEPVAEKAPMNETEYLEEVHKIMSSLSGDKDIYVEQYGYAVNDNYKEGKQNAALQLNAKIVNAYGGIVDLGVAPKQYAEDIDTISKALTESSQHFGKVSDSLTPESDADTEWKQGLARLEEALSLAYELTKK